MQTKRNKIARALLSTLLLLLSSPLVFASNPEEKPEANPASNEALKSTLKLNGWNQLAKKLVADGISPTRVVRVLSDKRMSRRKVFEFNLKPKEPYDIYSKHNSKRNRRNALKFYRKNKTTFQKAEKEYGVDKSIVLAILQVETQCGNYTGKSRVLPQLAKLASASDLDIVISNFKRISEDDGDITIFDVKKRADWLTETFYPHVSASFHLADELGLKSPLDLRGSPAGAYGLGQFLPGNYFLYGRDGNGDNLVDPFNPTDSIFSVSSFLYAHGWNKRNLTLMEKKAVIRGYNNSDPYIDTVLSMAKKLRSYL